jgi:2,3-bisphosphoglycerate-independent phosphoglycerate mutase
MTQPWCLLIILDGFGVAEPSPGNAVSVAWTPFVDALYERYPHATLACHGEAVGLPPGQMGNSEVGHLNLGAGRIVYQDISRINRAIDSGDFRDNPALNDLMDKVLASGGALHLLGLVSDGGVHSDLPHLYALLELAKSRGLERVFVHAFLDGRDTDPHSGADYVAQVAEFMARQGIGRFATLGGRYHGMDRDRRWERIETHYRALVKSQGRTADDPVAAVKSAYDQGETDEFVSPVVIVENGAPVAAIADGDGVVFFNFRADRAREMTAALTAPDFGQFDVTDRPRLAGYVCMTRYDDSFDLPAAFPPERPTHTLGQVVAEAGLRQLRLAETEKYAHVTYFFSGGEETPFRNEDRMLIDSPRDVPTYDHKPPMSALELTDELDRRIRMRRYQLIVINFANGDMVGHTGDLAAAVAAVRTLDLCLARAVPLAQAFGGSVMITSDHGNCEQMIDPDTGQPYTAHTVTNPVPLILADDLYRGFRLTEGGKLADVAPTVLDRLGLHPPVQMTGRSLIERG